MTGRELIYVYIKKKSNNLSTITSDFLHFELRKKNTPRNHLQLALIANSIHVY